MAEQLYGLTESDRAFLRSLRQQFDGGALAPQIRRTQFPLPDRNYGRVWFRNDASGAATASAYACMRVTGITTVNNRPVVTIAKPDTSFNRLYLVNGDKDVENGKYGWGTWLWHSDYVLYDNASTPAVGEEWGPQDGQWTIKKWRYGFTIMGGNVTSPVRTTAVQHFVNSFWGQTDGTLTKGSTATVSVYDGNDADTSVNVASVKNKFATVASSKKVGVYWWGGSWYAIAAEC